jgi:hypothetical protein
MSNMDKTGRAIEVDITSLPASEQAALAPILRAARDLDSLYMQQVLPGTRALIRENSPLKTLPRKRSSMH